MEPRNQQQQQIAGYYSSLLFQPDYHKLSPTINSGIIWESWASRRGSKMLNTADEMLLSDIKPEMPSDSLPNLTEVKESQDYLSTHQQNILFSNYFCPLYDNHNLAQNNLLYSYDDAQKTASPVSETSSACCKFDFTHLLNLSNSEYCLSNSLQHQHPLPAIHNVFRDSPSASSNQSTAGRKRSKSNSNSSEAKRHKASSTSACPPLKEVKKEKVRERIATLQRLIAPYGKTDTASVLTETIGYIQFLHDQLQTLSVPYIKSSSSCNPTTLNQPRLSKWDSLGQGSRRDLSSRGLCLVPLSSAAFFKTFNDGI